MIVCGGETAESPKQYDDVIKYDIGAGKWSTCPSRMYAYINHSSLCVNGKLYLFFGQYKGRKKKISTLISSDVIEMFDIKAHI